jgi:hypothetical protein
VLFQGFHLPFNDFASNEIAKVVLPKTAEAPGSVDEEFKPEISPKSQ